MKDECIAEFVETGFASILYRTGDLQICSNFADNAKRPSATGLDSTQVVVKMVDPWQ